VNFDPGQFLRPEAASAGNGQRKNVGFEG